MFQLVNGYTTDNLSQDLGRHYPTRYGALPGQLDFLASLAFRSLEKDVECLSKITVIHGKWDCEKMKYNWLKMIQFTKIRTKKDNLENRKKNFSENFFEFDFYYLVKQYQKTPLTGRFC